MTTIETTQHHVGQLIRIVEGDLDRRGVLMLDRAQNLLSDVKKAKLVMSLCEQTTPADFFNAQWKRQAKSLGQIQTRLSRIIKGVRIPVDDHEATIR